MSTEQEKPIWKCAGCAHPPHGICLAGRGEVCRCLGQPENDVVCQHGTAADVHCCNCHSGFVFDHTRCVCGSSTVLPAGAQGETQAEWRKCSLHPDVDPRTMWGCPDCVAQLRRETKAQAEEIARLRAELETRDMQLAGCSTAAIQNTSTSVRERIEPGHPYYSAAYGDVCRAVDREMQHRDTVQALQAQLECMVAPEERDQWRREAQRLAVERAYVQGVFLDAGVEVGPDLGEAARAMADLLSESQRRVDALIDEMSHLVQSVASRRHWSQTGDRLLVVPEEAFRRAQAFLKAVQP